MHHVNAQWDLVMGRLRVEITQRQLHPARTLVLLPLAQLIAPARAAWLRTAGAQVAHFLPRFETALSWARSLTAFVPDTDDLQLDAARDLLTATSLLARAGLGARQHLLAPRLVDAAWSLARVAAAVAPAERVAWGAERAVRLSATLDTAMLALEAALERIALAWVANSSYPTDALFAAEPELLVLVEGLQAQPLNLALMQTRPERVLTLPLALLAQTPPVQLPGSLALHAAQDAEDEAQRAAACVLLHLAAGRVPVALVAQDRMLTRRVHALLVQQGISVSDEAGWTLSTTRAAASLMSLLRACAWDASTDTVLDWLKHASVFDPLLLASAEVDWRQRGLRDWRRVPVSEALAAQAQALREMLQSDRQLVRWLSDLRLALQGAGQWDALLHDPAGELVLDALRLRDGAEIELSDVSMRLSQSQFVAWVSQTLENRNFSPSSGDPAQVFILPLSQLLGRPLAALVFPGCDEVSLPGSPELTGVWTPAQRALLGLPTREQLAAVLAASWRYALGFAHVDVLWRQSEAGERLMPSSFVQALRLEQVLALTPNPCPVRVLTAQPCLKAAARGDRVTVQRLSATAYEDLRRCPYRFFALRQLRLQAQDELDTELDKRDFGNWLHHLLKLFHVNLQGAGAVDDLAREAMLNAAAQQATRDLALSDSEFLPFAAAWARVRGGYSAWLAAHEASGATFMEAESSRETRLGSLTLIGKIDRIDRLVDGSALVIDYKTEAPASTAQRLKAALEDTQLAFYAALLSDDSLAAAYLNLSEKEGCKAYVQSDIVALRDELLEGIATDLARIGQGAALWALGAGKACEFCAARGLCRKDFWTQP
jgi:ATP-dependent helicase/nuclease subunit B